MDIQMQKRLIDVAAGREPADLVITNCRIVDVYSSEIIEGQSIAVAGGYIAGIGDYEGCQVVDGRGMYAAPGFIEGHIHIESSYVTPEELGRLLVPWGTTTIIADPHEIVNVAGLSGLDYMLAAAEKTRLDIKYMMPSCVPATPWESSGARIEAGDMRPAMEAGQVWGLGEFMDFPGVVEGRESLLEKLLLARENGMIVDGHSPGLSGKGLNAYVFAGIHTEHECDTADAARERVARGMYVMLREGSACHDLLNLLPAVNEKNSHRFLFCSDDRQLKTIFEHGHLNHHMSMCATQGIDPLTALQMGTLNGAQCYRLDDRGAIAPGLRADIVLLEDLKHFRAKKVWIQGELAAEDGQYLFPVERQPMDSVMGTFKVSGFSGDALKFRLKSGRVHVMELLPGGVVTRKAIENVTLSPEGDFVFNPAQDIVKVAVVERHHGTGKTALGFLKGYGLKYGAIATSIAHDSHNIIVAGADNGDMEAAVEALIAQGGGIALVKDKEVLASLPLKVGGLMSDAPGQWVNRQLSLIHETAFEVLKVDPGVDPVTTLSFMSLSVIPALKLTLSGLYDVEASCFVPVEAM